ncbi:MAG: TonB-dependent receptor [Proteobacteria bacterium]|nr:TonB-dependent receptor [Pseudomonadota bacterium]
MNLSSRLRAQLLLGGALLAMTATPALAQTAPAATPASAPENQPAPQDTSSEGLADIVVTATKVTTNLQKTPISISVLNTEALTDRHVQSLFNLADGTVPSLRIATFEARQSALTIGIRGIVPYDQNQTARDGGVSVYVDSVALGKTQGLNAALFDVERIEVLKGPQGTLFGRNTEGGALSLVTRAPSGEFEGRIAGGLGNYGSRNGEIHVDLPKFMDFSFKLDGIYQHQDATVKNPLAGSYGWNYYDREGGRAAARWEPFTGFIADFAYDYAKDENTPQYSPLLSYNPRGYAVGTYVNTAPAGATPVYSLLTSPTGVPCGGTIAAGSTKPVCIAPLAPLVKVHTERQKVADIGVPQQPSVDITHGFSANLKYTAAPWLELRAITAWRGVSTDQWDNSGGANRSTFAPNANFSRYSLSYLRQHQFSQEFQAVGSSGGFSYVFGAYYFRERATEYAATPLSNQFNADGSAYTIRNPIIDSSATGVITSANSGYQPYAPSCNNTLAPVAPQFTNSCQFITRASEAFDHNYSAFGNVTYTPQGADWLHITAGGRWTKDKRYGQLYVVNNRADLNPLSATPNSVARPFTFSNSISRFDPMINVAVDATDDIHLYAKYSTGFRAGGANDRSRSFNAFGPESVKSYEIGAKMNFWNHRARLNLAGFIMDRSNTQFDFDLFDTNATSPTNGAHIEQTQNAGKSKIRGIEADFTLKPVPELTLTASYAYTYWKAPSAVNSITGGLPQQLYIVYTPKNAASGAIDYEIPVGGGDAKVRVHLDAAYANSQYSFQLEPTKTDPSFIVNGRVALADLAVGTSNRVTFAFWVRNLFDRTYVYRRSSANSSPVLNYNGAALVSANFGGILGDYGNLNPPRTWGFELSAKF